MCWIALSSGVAWVWGWGMGLGNKQGEETDKGALLQGTVSLDPHTGFIRGVVLPPFYRWVTWGKLTASAHLSHARNRAVCFFFFFYILLYLIFIHLWDGCYTYVVIFLKKKKLKEIACLAQTSVAAVPGAEVQSCISLTPAPNLLSPVSCLPVLSANVTWPVECWLHVRKYNY